MRYKDKDLSYKGYTIEIHSDEDPLNPRTEWDNVYLGCFSSKEGAKETEKLTSVNAVLIDGGDIIIQPATIDGHKYVEAYSKQFQNLSICPVRGE